MRSLLYCNKLWPVQGTSRALYFFSTLYPQMLMEISTKHSESSGRWRWLVFSNTELICLSSIDYNIQLLVWNEIRCWNKVLDLEKLKIHHQLTKQQDITSENDDLICFQGRCLWWKFLVLWTGTMLFLFLHQLTIYNILQHLYSSGSHPGCMSESPKEFLNFQYLTYMHTILLFLFILKKRVI